MSDQANDCLKYRTQQSEEYDQEVAVGNVLLGESDSVPDAAAGASAGAIDALYTPTATGQERLVECKQSVGFRGLGQLILYAYFRRRDREIVREQYDSQPDGWETKRNIDHIVSHVYKEDDGSRYHAKPPIEEIEQVLVVPEISEADTLRLSAYADLGITVAHRTDGIWREVNTEVLATNSADKRDLTTEWLEHNSRDTLDSATEETLFEDISELFEDATIFREVPIGTHLYPDSQPPLRADAVIQAGEHWFVVEVKNSTNKQARPDFQRGVGQAIGYANLFAREWGLPSQQVAPVVSQEPLALAGGVYREDRVGTNYEAMRAAAFRSSNQPLVLGPSQRYQKLPR